MPLSPASPAPRMKCMRTVSTWSSAVCPTATACALKRRAWSIRKRYRMMRAASSSDIFSVPAYSRTSPLSTTEAMFMRLAACSTALASASASERSLWLKCATMTR
ncbi:MAG: hypothetical protein MZV64_59865 [Ignavibacteriales bacterium]|nr:hypothetical protein [Ignavibacteriales bacterium]